MARTQKDILNHDGTCTHFEVLELPGAKIFEMHHVVSPILEFLSKNNKLMVLIVCGVNDLLQTELAYMTEFEAFTALFDVLGCNAKFIELPLIPSLSRLDHDNHVVRFERIQDILSYNEALRKFNINSLPVKCLVPSLKFMGVKKESDGTFPNGYKHVPECWDRWDTQIPKSNCIHLATHVKVQFWSEIAGFFRKNVQQ